MQQQFKAPSGQTGAGADLASLVAAASHVSLPMLVAKQARLRPDEWAVVDGEHAISRRELELRTHRLARHLVAAGLKPGDRIGLLCENAPAYIELALAAARQGFVLAMLNWRLTPAELLECVNLVQPSVIFVSPQQQDKIDAGLRAAVPCTELGADFDAVLAAQSGPLPPDADVAPEQGLFIAFTSGTSGLPKGAVISHRAAIARLQLYIMQYGFQPGDTFLAWSPMFHMSSMELALSTLVLGGTVV
ncbi:MAG: class I adenylate-forming enzyme family protein, partial [Burkholderiaceae bacterium]|nr:class I adenylate-forming enzyme family protein [Burkholderiaceae bacterium]